MSINVTVNGNPVSIRKGRMVLSDLDQIKKNERDRRRRLRTEQVRQQSKEIASRLLERAKTVTQKELSRLEKDGRYEIKQMHDQKIMEMQRKYQEDMEDIGQAHLAATLQPDVDAIIQAEARRNRALALERGKEAAQKLKESEEKENLRVAQQERLRKVREMENARAAAVVKSKQVNSDKEEKLASDSSQSGNEIIEVNQKHPKTVTKHVTRKSPIKVITKSNVKVVADHSKLKSQAGPSGTQKKIKEKERNKEKRKLPESKVNLSRSKIRYDTHSSKSHHRKHPDSDIEENEEPCPNIDVNVSSNKSSKPSRYNPEDYIHESVDSSSSSDSSCSSSISEDSSYFSDAADPPVVIRTPKHHTTPVGSKVQVYDHNTRQRNAYNRPLGIVERIDIRNEPNAEDLAREVIELEHVNAELLKKRKTSAERRGQDALLRERVRRDYQNMLQNLDHLSREERMLKASQIHEPPNLHMSPMRRKDFQKKRQRKMNRAFEGILRASDDPPYTLTEKIVTLKPQEDFDEIQILPQASWQDSPFRDSIPPRSPEKKDSLDELSREEQILELLQKVERQKRILLREFGANLPPELLSSSRKPIDSKPSEFSKSRSPIQKPPSPEIQVINMSTHEEVSKPKTQEKKKVIQHTEIAVQTSTIEDDFGEDKSVQVELTEERCQSTEINEEISEDINNISQEKNKENQRHYPLEPVVKVLTPENVDSSSGSSIITDLVINFDKKQVQVTPKRKKKGALKISRKTSPMIFPKSRSVPGSKASTPNKKTPKSAPPSRLPTPSKTQDTKLQARHDLHVNRGFRAEIDHFGGLTVDSSTESSQIYSTPDNGSSGKVYRIHTRSSKKTIRIKDASDTTSTTYASPPIAQAAAFLKQRSSIDTTPILEMLDSRAVDALHIGKSQISPVSTPETPSPRTMKLPSNVPNPEKISRMLKFSEFETDTRRGRSSQTTSNDQGRSGRQRIISTPPRSPQRSVQRCNCNNPSCKMHENLEDIDNQALKNCPEIQKLYEELENVCAERIATLSDLIKNLRNEQKVLPPGMDFSLATPQDNTSFLQLSPGSIPHDLRDVRNLVENVEAINNQLARTLQESRRIIAGEGINLPKPPVSYSQIQKSPELSDSKSKESITSYVDEEEPEEIQEPTDRVRPRVISIEPVNLNIDRFRITRSPSKLEGKNEREAGKVSQSGHEDMVEKISKEILEQSKSIDKSSGFVTLESFKETDSYLAMRNEFNLDELDSSKEHEEETALVRGNSQGTEKKEDFIPFLAGIPKFPRAFPNSNSRGRPPVTLVSGPYRSDLASPIHELSTIVEFDTPDTANRSQTSVRTSPSKAKRNLATDMTPSSVSPTQKSAFKKPLDLSLHKISNTSKPSVHVAPLPSHRIPQTTPKRSPTQKSSTQLFSNGLQIPRSKCQEKFDAFAIPKGSKNDSSESSEQQAIKNEELQLDGIHRDEKSTSNILQSDDPQKKMTSSSSNSFSALSGISEIASTPSSDFLKCASSPEEMERTLKKFGLGWAITTLKKTREACALSSSSNSDITPINTARRIISPIKRQAESHYLYGLPDLSDVSSISIKEASKSTERAVLLKGRTSTPNILNSNSDKSGSTTTSSSCISLRDPNDSLIVPNLFLSHGKKNRTNQTKDL